MIFISLIIPIYNASQYLDRCLSSILSQTYAHFECLLIDDGSTDASGEICKHYVGLDTRFSYYHKENGGEASARNFGLAHAHGEYVCWVDADDYVTPEYLAELVSSLQQDTDLVIQSHIRVIDDSEQIVSGAQSGEYDFSKELDSIQFFSSVDLDHFGVSYSKLFRLSLIRQSNLQYSSAIVLAVDLDFLLRYLACCHFVKVTKQACYYYVIRQGSVSTVVRDFGIEQSGLEQLDSSFGVLSHRFPTHQVKRLRDIAISAYLHRTLLACYKPGISTKTRKDRFVNVDKSLTACYQQYGPKSTSFLRVANYLFTHHHLVLFDLLMSYTYRVRYPLK